MNITKLYYKLGELLGIKPKVTEVVKTVIKPVETIVIKEGVVDTALEKYCSKAFKEVSRFAYKDKGLFKKQRYAMYPNELIQPELRLVEKVRKEVGVKPVSFKAWVLKVGTYVDKRLKWTGDDTTTGFTDIYQDTYAVIMDPLQDCESHSGLVSSIEPELGIAYGFSGVGGHAWNVFVRGGELWCLETNSIYDKGNNTRVFKYAGQDTYKVHYIFTKNKTFKCNASRQHFGVLDR